MYNEPVYVRYLPDLYDTKNRSAAITGLTLSQQNSFGMGENGFAGYERVVESTTGNGEKENSYYVFDKVSPNYSSKLDEYIDFYFLNLLYNSNTSLARYIGTKFQESIYHESGHELSRTVYTEHETELPGGSSFSEQKYFALALDNSLQGSTQAPAIQPYNISIPFLARTKEEARLYDENGSSYTTTKEYDYGLSTTRAPTRITETNSLSSEQRVTELRYAFQLNSGMQNLNMLSQPYYTEVKEGSTVLSKNWTEWTNNSTISPGSKWRKWKEWNWAQLGTSGAPTEVTSPTQGNALKAVEVIKYDTYGNPLEMKDVHEVKTSYSWSEEGDFPIGIFKNAESNKVFAHSFAKDGLNNWTIRSGVSSLNTEFNIEDGKLKITTHAAAPNNQRDYIKHVLPVELQTKLIWEFDVQIANSNSWNLQMNAGGSSWDGRSNGSGSEAAVWTAINNEEWKVYDGSIWITLKTGLVIGGTYSFKVVIDPSNDVADYYLDGELLDEQVSFRRPSSGIKTIAFGHYGHDDLSVADWYIDNVRMYPEEAEATSQEVESLLKTPLAIKDASGNTSRFKFDDFGRLTETYNANDVHTTTHNYYFSVPNNSGVYDATDPNYVETIAYFDGSSSSTSTSFLDGIGREVQTQQRGNTKVIATETLYNELGLPEVTSRPIEKTTTQIPGYYSSGLLGGSVTPGTSIAPTTLVATYYDEFHTQTNDDDELYAYSVTEYEASPLVRVEKASLPGEDYQTVNAKAVKISYGLNTEEAFETDADISISLAQKSWPANSLSKTVSEDPSNKKMITYTNGWGQTIASGVDISGDGKLIRHAFVNDTTDLVTEYAYDIRGNLVRKEDPKGLVSTYTYNVLGQLVESQLPDQVEPNSYCYDDKGRLRFHRDPKHVVDVSYISQAPQYNYHYTRYDDLDRPIEEGEKNGYGGDFDSICSTNKNNQSYPSSYYNPKVYYHYDGESAATGARNLKGKLTRTQYKDLNTGSWGYTWYSYNALGQVEWIVQRLPGQLYTQDKKIIYTYDDIGRTTQVHFDSDLDPIETSEDFYFWYEYDELGRLEKILSGPSSLKSNAGQDASFIYLADGSVKQLKLGPDGTPAQTVDFSYTIQGWLNKINNGTVSSTAQGDRFGMILDYEDNGNVKQQKWTQQAASNSNELTYDYSYDKANRIESALFSGSGFNTLAYDVSEYGYDPNGNILSIKRRNELGNYDKYVSTEPVFRGNLSMGYTDNWLTEITDLETSSDYNPSYDANGNMTTNPFNGITSVVYDWRNLPTTMVANGSTIKYAYDAEGNRVKKELVGQSTIWYVRGADGQIIAAYDGSNNLIYWMLPAGLGIIN